MKLSQEVRRWSEVMENYVVIHCDTADGTDYTLCGVAQEGENGDNQMLRTRRRITCRSCIGIIRYCKSIPTRLLNSPALSSGERPND